MSIKRTVKYHVPQKGLYLYARSSEEAIELIVLNSTDCEQTLLNEHIRKMLKEGHEGTEISSGKKVNLNNDLIIPARKSIIIECKH